MNEFTMSNENEPELDVNMGAQPEKVFQKIRFSHQNLKMHVIQRHVINCHVTKNTT